MGLFKWLPKTERCCWCTRNLKYASFIIVLAGMFTSTYNAVRLCKPQCKELYDVSSPVRIASNVLRWILFISELVVLASAFVFLVGIFFKLPKTADVFIATVLVRCVISVVYIIIIVVHELNVDCPWYHSEIYNMVLYLLMWWYFVIVLSSYAEEM